jgi:integrase
VVVLPAGIVEMLREHRRRQLAEKLAAGPKYDDRCFVFATVLGKPIDYRRDWGRWKELCVQAGVRDARLHDARHSSATFALLDQIDPAIVMARHGWGNRVLVDRYQHAVEAVQRDAAAKTNERFFGGRRRETNA